MTTRPPWPRSASRRPKAWQATKVPRTLTSQSRSRSASEYSSAGPSRLTPGGGDQDAERPPRVGRGDRRLERLRVGDVGDDRGCLGARRLELGDRRLQLVLRAGEQGHRGARLGQRRGGGAAEAAAAAGDEGVAAGERRRLGRRAHRTESAPASFSTRTSQLRAWPSKPSTRHWRAQISPIRTHAGRVAHLLVGDRLEELADPEAAGVAGGAGGRQDVVGADRLVAVGDGGPLAEEERAVVAHPLQVPARVLGQHLDVLGGELVGVRDRLLGRVDDEDLAVVAPGRARDLGGRQVVVELALDLGQRPPRRARPRW